MQLSKPPKILSTVGVDTPASCSFKSYQNLVNSQNWQQQFSELPKTWNIVCFLLTIIVDNRSFQSYLKTGKQYAYCRPSDFTIIAYRDPKLTLSQKLIFLLTVALRASKILSTVGLDNLLIVVYILIDYSFQSYQNPFNNGS